MLTKNLGADGLTQRGLPLKRRTTASEFISSSLLQHMRPDDIIVFDFPSPRPFLPPIHTGGRGDLLSDARITPTRPFFLLRGLTCTDLSSAVIAPLHHDAP